MAKLIFLNSLDSYKVICEITLAEPFYIPMQNELVEIPDTNDDLLTFKVDSRLIQYDASRTFAGATLNCTPQF